MKITINNLHKHTAQEVFDVITDHLITQGKQSKSESGACYYRGKENLKCAAGILIPDNMYVHQMELRDWISVYNTYGPKGISEEKTHIFLIRELQLIHDECKPPCWVYNLQKLAKMYKLKFIFHGEI